MFSKWRWLLANILRQLWIRAALFGVLAIVMALMAVPIERYLENPLPFTISSEAVFDILNILASSMLAVTTFSLGVMVTAYGSASSIATPRANLLVKQDATSHNVLATFLGSFIFSLVGIIALRLEVYGENGRLVLFAATIGIIVLIVATILRWIEHLAHLGRLGETTQRVEDATTRALTEWQTYPCMGGRELTSFIVPADALPIFTDKTGYIQHIDTGALACCAEACHGEIAVLGMPGKFIHPGKPIAWLRGSLEKNHITSVRDAFSVGDRRSFEQDPRFGLSVLAEIASRALSPAVNDPGTAIDIIGRAVRVLLGSPDNPPTEDTVHYPRVWLPGLKLADMFDDIFLPIARDGAAMVEVQVRLLKSLKMLVDNDSETFLPQAKRIAAQILTYADNALCAENDKQRLKKLASEIN